MRVTQKDIIKAIGNHKNFTNKDKKRFARVMQARMKNLFNGEDAAFPSNKIVKEFLKEIENMHAAVSNLEKLQDSSRFTEALINASSRMISQRGYRAFDLEDVKAFILLSKSHANNEQFLKQDRGPDSRTALFISYYAAYEYQRIFREEPAYSRSTESPKTPFQRICDVCAKPLGIRIGTSTIQTAFKHLKESNPPFQNFKPDVTNLLQKHS